MTLCLAALCKENGESRAVVVADRMVTYPGFIEYEHAASKIGATSQFTLAMVAGSALVGNRLVREAAETLKGTNPRVGDIAKHLSQRYEAVRAERIEHEILMPRGLNYGVFYDRHATLNSNITMVIDQAMVQYNPEVELLLAGVDDTGAHVYTVHNPGGPELQHDVTGFAAVGSGTIHAMQSMIGFRHAADANYHETVFRAYASKRRSEIAPGVGAETDACTISPAGVHWLTEEEMAQLQGIYEEHEKTTSKALTERLAKFKLGEPTGSEDEETTTA